MTGAASISDAQAATHAEFAAGVLDWIPTTMSRSAWTAQLWPEGAAAMSNSKLRQLAQKATQGEWHPFVRTGVYAVFGPAGARPNSEGVVVGWPGFDSAPGSKSQRSANCRFIAAANPVAVLSLLDDNDALAAENDQLRAEVEAMRAFVTECAGTAGGMVNGNKLSNRAKELIAAMAAKEAQ